MNSVLGFCAIFDRKMGSKSPDGKDDGLLDKTVRRGHRRSSWAVSKTSLLFFFLLLAAFFMLAAAM
jgi:hypothetical protein